MVKETNLRIAGEMLPLNKNIIKVNTTISTSVAIPAANKYRTKRI
jgi:hypothetical protein